MGKTQQAELEAKAIAANLLAAAVPHVAFDGWSDVTLRAAAADIGVPIDLAKALFPRGGIDMALAFHRRADEQMREALPNFPDFHTLRYSQKVAAAVRCRLEVVENDKEVVRQGATLLSLPHYTFEGTKAVWGTADAIWCALGDSSNDVNWYSKRATLSAVYAASVLYWLGDNSAQHSETWAFIDRRISDVMRFEKIKAQVKRIPVPGFLASGVKTLGENIRPPKTEQNARHLPGYIGGLRGKK